MSTTELLGKLQWELHHIKLRHLAIQSFVAALEQLTQGREFRIMNASTWHHMLDARDMVLVHLASWARSLTEKGGFWGKVKANGTAELFVKAPFGQDREARSWQIASDRRCAFEALFPAAAGEKRRPSHDDIDVLAKGLAAALRPVVDDRNQVRAHPYEKDGAGTAAMLSFEELDAAFEQAETVLNNLGLVLSGSTFGFPDTPLDDGQDVALLIVFGSFQRFAMLTGANAALHDGSGRWLYQYREEYIEQLHATEQVGEYFNDVS